MILGLEGRYNAGTEVFFIIWKKQGSSHKPVYKSEGQPQMNGKQKWKDLVIETNLLCGGRDNEEWRIDFIAARADGNHKCIGTKNLSIDALNSG